MDRLGASIVSLYVVYRWIELCKNQVEPHHPLPVFAELNMQLFPGNFDSVSEKYQRIQLYSHYSTDLFVESTHHDDLIICSNLAPHGLPANGLVAQTARFPCSVVNHVIDDLVNLQQSVARNTFHALIISATQILVREGLNDG